MGNEEERARFFAWWEATGGGNTSLRAMAEQAFICGSRKERIDCIAICREVSERYPTDIFPEDGQSLDCKSARMARLTAANIEREITERSNDDVTGLAPEQKPKTVIVELLIEDANDMAFQRAFDSTRIAQACRIALEGARKWAG